MMPTQDSDLTVKLTWVFRVRVVIHKNNTAETAGGECRGTSADC